jgi:serine/threonine-protein kinase HipA
MMLKRNVMMNEDMLTVVHKNGIVGTLTKTADADFIFQYDPQWIESRFSFPVSQSLPLQMSAFSKGDSTRFFSNLLPEGLLRRSITRQLGISEDNDFELLKLIGGECAGALSIIPAGSDSTADDQVRFQYNPLLPDDLESLAKRGKFYSSIAYQKPMRLSLAGAQDKLPVLFKDDTIYLPEGNSPSSHIIKFPNKDFKYLPENEVITTRIARDAGLPAVEAVLLKTGNMKVCMIKRFDRMYDGKRQIERLHQEDMCQALSYSHKNKYENEGGPSFAQCFDCVSKVSCDPITDCESLIHWQIFNLCAGNSDGHAKNISFLYNHRGDVRLAPFYDLVNTAVYPKLDYKLAMSIGGCSVPGEISNKNWKSFAADCGIQYTYLQKIIMTHIEKIKNATESALSEFTALHGYCPITERIRTVILKRIRRIIQLLE